MSQIPRAVRRSHDRPAIRPRKTTVLAAATVAALVALSAQGAATAWADDAGDASSSSVVQAQTAGTPETAQAAGVGQTADAAAPAADSAVEAAEGAETPGPADAAEPSGDTAVEHGQETSAPADAGTTGPAEVSQPADTAGAADPTPATEASEPAAAPAPAAGTADPARATEVPGPLDALGGSGAGDPAALVNTPPVGVADYYTLAVDTVLTVPAPGVVGNDYDAEGDFLTTAQSYTGTGHGGHVLVLWDRSIVYTPAPGFVGTDTWSYWVCDPTSKATAATPVTFTVVDTTDVAPVAHDDSYATPADTTLVVTGTGVLANDSDTDSAANQLAVVSALAQAGSIATSKGGTVDWMTTGGFSYTPAPGFIGYDTVTYWITDGVLESGLATVTIKVGDWANLPPVASDDHYVTAVNHVLTVDAAHGLLANDTDATDPLSVIVPAMLETGRASVVLHSDGSFSYSSHYYNTLGPDTFTYQVTDGGYNLPVTATVTIDVQAFANAAPSAVDDNYTTPKNTGLGVGAAMGLLANDSDPDQDAITIPFAQPNEPTAAGGIVNVGADGSFSFTPATGFVGVDTFSYQIIDFFGEQASASAFVTVTDPHVVGNSMPVATDDHYSTTPDTTLTVSGADGMLVNDVDVDGDPLSSIIPAVPYGSASLHGGTVTGTPDGGFSYTPPAGFVGEDEFVYEVMDESPESFDVGTVRITVAAATAEVIDGRDGTEGAGDPDAGATGGAAAASDATGITPAAGASGSLAHTGAAPDATLALSLLLLLTGAAGIVVAAMAHRRGRRS